jgi:hypothetical protein
VESKTGAEKPSGGLRGAWSGLSRLWKVLAGVAAAIVLLSGVATAFGQTTSWWQQLHSTPPPSVPPSQLDRTPILGVQLWQSGERARMALRTDSKGLEAAVDVYLKKAPFEIWFPALGANDEMQLCAWTDNTLFTMFAPNSPLPEGPPFGLGTGLADYEFTSGTLYVTKDGHNALFGSRLAPAGNGMQKMYVSTLTTKAAPQGVPIAKFSGDLYIALYIDKRNDNKFDWGEFEYIQLHFS